MLVTYHCVFESIIILFVVAAVRKLQSRRTLKIASCCWSILPQAQSKYILRINFLNKSDSSRTVNHIDTDDAVAQQ